MNLFLKHQNSGFQGDEADGKFKRETERGHERRRGKEEEREKFTAVVPEISQLICVLSIPILSRKTLI